MMAWYLSNLVQILMIVGIALAGGGGGVGDNDAKGKSGASEEDPARPIIMDQEDREVQQLPRTNSLVLSENIERWNSGTGGKPYFGSAISCSVFLIYILVSFHPFLLIFCIPPSIETMSSLLCAS